MKRDASSQFFHENKFFHDKYLFLNRSAPKTYSDDFLNVYFLLFKKFGFHAEVFVTFLLFCTRSTYFLAVDFGTETFLVQGTTPT